MRVEPRTRALDPPRARPNGPGPNALVAWAEQLAGSRRVDPEILRILDVASVLDAVCALTAR